MALLNHKPRTFESSMEDRLKRLNNFQDEAEQQQGAQQQAQTDMGEYQRLLDYQKQHSDPKMWEWVEKQEEVARADEAVTQLFVSWMFSLNRDVFAKWVKDSGLPHINNHVDTAIKVSQEYRSPEDIYAEERESYKTQIASLQQAIDALTATTVGAKEEVQRF